MKPDIYEQHDKAFANVSAYVVANADGNRVATVAFKFPRDGASRLYCYVHWLGVPMVRGFAGGYGYDKQTAALANAIAKLINAAWDYERDRETLDAFLKAAGHDGGKRWNDALHDAGFTVWQAV